MKRVSEVAVFGEGLKERRVTRFSRKVFLERACMFFFL